MKELTIMMFILIGSFAGSAAEIILNSGISRHSYHWPMSGSLLMINDIGTVSSIPEPSFDKCVLLSSPNCISVQHQVFRPPSGDEIVIIHSNGRIERSTEKAINGTDIQLPISQAKISKSEWDAFCARNPFMTNDVHVSPGVTIENQLKAWGYESSAINK